MITNYILNYAQDLWMGKWKSSVRYLLRNGPLRFSELKQELPDCSVKVLSEVLADMVKKGIIIRVQYNTMPVRVTYELSESAKPIVSCMENYIKATALFMVNNQDILQLPSDKIEEIKSHLLTDK